MPNSESNTDVVVEARALLIELKQDRTSALCKAVTHIVVTAKTENVIKALCDEVERARAQYEGAISDFAAEINSVRAQLAQVTQERDRLTEDLRILTKGRIIQS